MAPRTKPRRARARPRGPATLILHSVGPAPGALAAPWLSRELAADGYRVEVVLEPNARYFVGPAAFGDPVRPVDEPSGAPEVALYAPATAGSLARLARGLGGGTVGARLVLVAPDLDLFSAEHPAVKENLELLRESGCRVVAGSGGGMAPAGEVVAGLLGGLGG